MAANSMPAELMSADDIAIQNASLRTLRRLTSSFPDVNPHEPSEQMQNVLNFVQASVRSIYNRVLVGKAAVKRVNDVYDAVANFLLWSIYNRARAAIVVGRIMFGGMAVENAGFVVALQHLREIKDALPALALKIDMPNLPIDDEPTYNLVVQMHDDMMFVANALSTDEAANPHYHTAFPRNDWFSPLIDSSSISNVVALCEIYQIIMDQLIAYTALVGPTERTRPAEAVGPMQAAVRDAVGGNVM
jgi:hypothetical protein